MKILTDGKQYRCTDYRVSKQGAWYALPDGVPKTLGDTVTLQDDGGFELAIQTVGGYRRWYTTERALVLTNTTEEEEALRRAQAEQGARVIGLLDNEAEG